MNKRPLSGKNNANFYLPGEEINIRRDDMFAEWNDKTSAGFAGKGRILFGICAAAFAYLLVAFRLLDTCVLPNIGQTEPADASRVQQRDIHRADIVDRNGAVVATSLPTKDLDANAKNILHPRETALKLTELFPDLDFDTVYQKLKRRRGTFTLKRNLSPHQQSAVIALGNPGLEFRRKLPCGRGGLRRGYGFRAGHVFAPGGPLDNGYTHGEWPAFILHG